MAIVLAALGACAVPERDPAAPLRPAEIAAAFGAVPVQTQRFAIYIPSRDREGAPVEQRRWVEAALRLLAGIAGGATALPPATGAWLDRDSGKLVLEEPVVVYAAIAPDRLRAVLPELVAFVRRLGRETDQGSVAIELDGALLTVERFE